MVYSSIKRKLNRRLICDFRCDERLWGGSCSRLCAFFFFGLWRAFTPTCQIPLGEGKIQDLFRKGADMELAIRALRSNVLPTLLAVSQQGAKSKDADCLFEPARPPFMEGFLLGSVYSDACSFCKAQSPSSPISPGSLTSSTHRHLQASGYRSLTVTLDGQLLLIRPKNGKLSFENRQCIERVCDKPLSLGSDWCVSSNILCPEEFTLTSLEPHEHHRILLFAHKHDAEAWRRRQELLKPFAHLLILVEM